MVAAFEIPAFNTSTSNRSPAIEMHLLASTLGPSADPKSPWTARVAVQGKLPLQDPNNNNKELMIMRT